MPRRPAGWPSSRRAPRDAAAREAAVRPASLPVRPPRRDRRDRRRARWRHGRPLGRHALRSAAAVGARRPRLVGLRAGLPAVDRHRRVARRGERLDRPPVRRARAARPRRVHRHEGVRRHAAPVAAASVPRIATPCSIRRSRTRPTRWAPSSPVAEPCRFRSTTTFVSTSRRIDPSDAERALCLWVNSPSNPTGALDDLGAAAEWGRAPRRPRVQRRVLRRVHLGRPAAHDPRARHRRIGRGALALEAVEPGRRPRRLLRRRPGRSSRTCPRCASTSG